MNRKPNPFNITKAVDLTDQEINDFWVDIGESGLQTVIKPTSNMPMIILGGKGSGKTHLMRYFSFQLQKIRHDNLLDGIIKDRYLGIYLRCSGLNSNRFSGKGIAEETWRDIFCFYVELSLTELLLEVVTQIVEKNDALTKYDSRICSETLKLLDVIPQNAPDNLRSLITFIVSLRKNVDHAVNNITLSGRLEGFFINVTPGNLVFGLPKIISEYIQEFKPLTYIYLIDEFENLTVEQQKYFNTLYREKQLPTSFKIGARLYGLRTKMTFSADEENKKDSEYEQFTIDEFFRSDNVKYHEFVKRLCKKRIFQNGYSMSNLDKQFAQFDEKSFLNDLKSKFQKSEPPYFTRLKTLLTRFKLGNAEQIISLLKFPNDPLIERTNVFLFYRHWSDAKSSLLTGAENIQKETKQMYENPAHKGVHFTVLDKFKADILDQLILDCGEKIYYSGFETMADMSFGIPRNLLKILKQVFQQSHFSGESPFEGGVISLESQLNGIKDAAEWFFEDARMPGKSGRDVRNAISNLAHLLREIRYSNIPPECSLCSFTFNSTIASEDSLNCIELSVRSSYLIKVGERHDKNEKRIDPIYQLNGILAPKWDLPIYKRGEITLTKKELDVIFGSSYGKENFDNILKNRVDRYNAPFNIDSSSPLFNEI